MKDKKTVAIIMLSFLLAIVLVHDFLPRYQAQQTEKRMSSLIEQYKQSQTKEQRVAILQEISMVKPQQLANTTGATSVFPIIGDSKGYSEWFCWWLTGYAGRRDDAAIGGAYDECMMAFGY